MIRRLSESASERGGRLHLVLPGPDEVAPVRTGLSLTSRGGPQLRAWSLRRRGEDLSPELRFARFGLAARSDADRAVHALVDGAVRGAHVVVRPLVLTDGAPVDLPGAGADTPLVVAWTRQGPLPDPARVRQVVTGYPGPIVLLVDDRGPAIKEVLGLALGSTEHPAVAATGALLRVIERSHPTFRVAAESASQAERALRDVGPRTLMLVPVGEKVPAGLLATPHLLEERVPGRIGLVFTPADDRARRIAGVLEAVSGRRAGRAVS